jgi:hypothetical protein
VSLGLLLLLHGPSPGQGRKLSHFAHVLDHLSLEAMLAGLSSPGVQIPITVPMPIPVTCFLGHFAIGSVSWAWGIWFWLCVFTESLVKHNYIVFKLYVYEKKILLLNFKCLRHA